MIIYADTKTVSIIENEKLTSGGYNNTLINVRLSEEYKGLTCFLTFGDQKTLIVGNMAKLPTLKTGACKIGVYAIAIENGETVIRYSPTPASVFVNKGSYNENLDEPEAPTQTEYERIYSLIDEAIEKGQLKGDKGDSGIDGKQANVVVASTKTLESNEPAYVKNEYDKITNTTTLHFGIPKGEKDRNSIKDVKVDGTSAVTNGVAYINLAQKMNSPSTQGTDGQILGLQDGNPTWINQQGGNSGSYQEILTFKLDPTKNTYTLASKEEYARIMIVVNKTTASIPFFFCIRTTGNTGFTVTSVTTYNWIELDTSEKLFFKYAQVSANNNITARTYTPYFFGIPFSNQDPNYWFKINDMSNVTGNETITVYGIKR